MKVALLSQEMPYPPHKSGGANTIFNLFKNINGVEIDLILLSHEESKVDKPKELSDVFHDIKIVKLPKRQRFFLAIKAILTSQTVRSLEVYDEKVINALEGYDQVFIHDFPLIKYCSLIKQNKIFFICDSQIKLIDSYLKNEKKFINRVILNMKKKIYQKMITKHHENFGKLLYISEVDKEYDEMEFPFLKNNYFINNGVNFDYFTPSNKINYEYDIVFLGNFSYRPNYEAARHLVEDIIPKLVEIRPDLKSVIVGKNPPEQLIGSITNENITFTGFVEDVRDYLNKTKIFVSPLYSGAGMKNKILEAMAMNKLIIATDISYEGLSFNNNDFIVSANSNEEFIQQITYYLSIFDKIQDEIDVRNTVISTYSWKSQADKLLNIISN